MYRISVLRTVSWLVLLGAVLGADGLEYHSGGFVLFAAVTALLAPTGGAYFLIRSGRIVVARLLLLIGLLPVCLLGLTEADLGLRLAMSGYYGLTAQVLHATIAAAATIAMVGAIHGTVGTIAQLPRRPGIVAILRGRVPAPNSTIHSREPGRLPAPFTSPDPAIRRRCCPAATPTHTRGSRGCTCRRW